MFHDPAFAPREGCNISVMLSDGQFVDYPQPYVSPKKPSFLDNILRRSGGKEKEKGVKSPSLSVFKKSAESSPTITSSAEQYDRATAELIEQLQFEGRDEADILFHLSHIHDSHTVAPPAPPPPVPLTPPKESTNIFTQFFRDIKTAFREELGPEVVYEGYYPEFEDDLRRLTIGISSAPFFGALPPDSDLSYEELASLEPVYVGSKCVNNLPCCVHDGSPLPGDQTKCPVCLNDFVEGDSMKSLPCVHFYHADCIDSWLLVGHTCPVCKLLIE
eukprot:Phypoly_transcript_14620.p1 GENE.Phypoly_transcript_14620~~Phypoly_transcript_14620.p1  ORF type:complete len:274 (+),score=36.35 Phypoly_transcript_14620:73-894(+)